MSRTTVFGKALAGGELKKKDDDSDDLELYTLDELLRVQVTTAKMADLRIKAHMLDIEVDAENPLDQEPKSIFIKFKKRPTCGNKCGRITYKFFKALYCAYWFYYLPFISIFFSFWVPYKLGEKKAIEDPQIEPFDWRSTLDA